MEFCEFCVIHSMLVMVGGAGHVYTSRNVYSSDYPNIHYDRCQH